MESGGIHRGEKTGRLVKLSVIYVAALAFALFLHKYPIIRVTCPFKLLTGIPCPGCGGVRAVWLMLDGDFSGALLINPLSCAVVTALLLLPFLMIYDIVSGKDSFDALMRRPWPAWAYIFAAFLVAANWIWNIYKNL